MRPWERIWFNYWAARNIRRKDRPIHRIERALLIWPLHVLIWAKRLADKVIAEAERIEKEGIGE